MEHPDSQAPVVADVPLVLVDHGDRAMDAGPRRVAAGAVKFRAWQIHALTPPPPDCGDHDAYLIKVNMDLELEPLVPAPRWAEFGFEFTADDVFVTDVVPRRVTGFAPTQTYAVTRHLAFATDDQRGVGARPDGVIVASLPVPPLSPLIEALGVGSPNIRWRHTATTDEGVAVGSHTAWIVLLVPAGLRELPVRAIANYALAPAAMMGLEPDSDAGTFTVRLPVAERANRAPVRTVDGDGHAFDVFLCHAKQDWTTVSEIHRRLTDAGVTCWLDDERINPGASATRAMEYGLRNSRFLLACVSKNFAGSEWAQLELRSRISAHVKSHASNSILLLMINETDDEDDIVPFLLRDVRRIAYTRGQQFEELVEFILSTR